MIKFVYVVRRRKELSQDEFRSYWLEKHGPLVRKWAAALRARRYIQSHTLDTRFNRMAGDVRGAGAPYDGITEVWWDSMKDLVLASLSPKGREANRVLAEDEAKFCDLPNCSVFFTEEHVIF